MQDGDEWVINGHKWFTSGANVAAFSTVMCVTEPDAPAHERFSMIVVPTDTKGYQIVRIVPVMGETSGGHCEIKYTDVRVPLTNLLGPRGQAFTIAQKRLGPGRIYHCMRWLGQAQRAFELMVDRAINRQAFGGPLSDKQTIQNWIADSAAEIQAARLLTLNAAAKIDAGDEARVEISLIKFFGAKVLHDVIDRAIQVHGAMGVSEDTPLARMYRHARFARIYDGPDEVHRMVVSRRIVSEFKKGRKWDFGRGIRAAESRNAGGISRIYYSALTPRSPVRMRTTSSIGITKILPSPILPVRAARSIVSTTCAASSSDTIISSLTLGRKSTTYSAPR